MLEEDLASDEEIVEITEQQMTLITETQQYVRMNIDILTENDVFALCVDMKFDTDRIKSYLA